MTAPFVSSEDLESYLRLPANTIDETLAEIALDSACQAIRDECDQNLEDTEAVIYLSGDGSSSLIIPNHPVISVASIYESADTVSERLVDADDYIIDPDTTNTLLLKKNYWQKGRKNLRVTFTYGYTQVPSTVRLIALQVAGRIYEGGPYTADNAGNISANLMPGGGQLTDMERDALSPYRRRI